jgi:aspartyl-tRNA(Asn)/glutamyl-tRNA(Gln) amidotransferase subunit A
MSLMDLTLADAAAGVQSGAFTSRALTEAALERIEARNPVLNAVIRIEAETALAGADAIDCTRAAGGNIGPLGGVPLAHKDMFYRAGGLTTCGSKIRRDFRPDYTATVLERLGTSGAVYLGGLNMAEFAFGPTGHNEHYGHCRNPWNTDHVTGGSSSGSGSATAARMTFGALGSDTGGSIRLPAALCGLVGLKPTQTRVSRYGVMGLSFSLDTVGPLTRTVLDNALMLQAIAGEDANDPTASRRGPEDYAAAARAPNARGVRIGVARGYFEKHGDEASLAERDAALAAFKGIGAELVEVDACDMTQINTFAAAIMGPEAATLHAGWLRDQPGDYGQQMRARCEIGFQFSGVDYLSALQLRPKIVADFCDRVFSQCDVLLAPTFNIQTPRIDETDIGSGQGFERVVASLSRCTRPLNFLTLPGLALPTPELVEGMPASIQLSAPPFGEAQLYRLAAAYEAEVQYHNRLPSMSDS